MVEDHDIAMRIAHYARRRAMAVDGVARHLHLGKGAAHAVAIHDRQAGHRGGDQRLHRVLAADLLAGDCVDLDAKPFFQRANAAQTLAAFLDALVRHQRRADAAHGDDAGIVGQALERNDLHDMAFAQRLAHAQLADIGIAATAGAENAGADLQRLDHPFVEAPSALSAIKHGRHPSRPPP